MRISVERPGLSYLENVQFVTYTFSNKVVYDKKKSSS